MEEMQVLPDLIGEQCRVLYLSDEKNQVVLGVAGSGKSVEAIYRAFWLSLAHPDEKILILTYNNQINQDLKNRLAAVRQKFNKINYSDNIEIQRVYTYFKDLINNYRRKDDSYLPDDDQVLTAMRDEKPFLKYIFEKSRTLFPDSTLWKKDDAEQFITDEIYWMQKMNIVNEDQYLDADRIGRGSAHISEQQRKTMYKIFELYYKERKTYLFDNSKKYFNYNDIYLLIKKHCDIPEEVKPKYIIIDEVQDITPAMFEGLRAVIRDDGIWNVFGDLSQNIFGGRISWRKLGIQTRKIYRLRHNYRNTKEIGRLGKSILDNLLAKQDNNGEFFIEPELSAFSGAKPLLCQAKDEAWLNKLQEYIKNGTTAVLALGSSWKIQKELQQAGFKVVTDVADIRPGTIYVTTVGRSKGLEFDNVVVYGIDNPERGIDMANLDEDGYLTDNLDEATQIEVARTIYVALTRARKNLILVYHNNSLPFLFTNSELIEKVQD